MQGPTQRADVSIINENTDVYVYVIFCVRAYTLQIGYLEFEVCNVMAAIDVTCQIINIRGSGAFRRIYLDWSSGA
jgi:hypothetical protein